MKSPRRPPVSLVKSTSCSEVSLPKPMKARTPTFWPLFRPWSGAKVEKARLSGISGLPSA